MKRTLLLAAAALTGIFASAQSPLNTLNFDGTDDYVTCPLPSIFTNIATGDFTVEAWINPGSVSSAGRIFFAQVDASNFATALISNGSLLFYVKSSNTTYTQSIPMPAAGQWIHTAFTWTAATQLPLIYVDGTLQTGTSGGASSSGANNVMTIGSRTDGAQPLTGSIDEFRIWNTARTLCELRSMMHSTPTGAEANLVSCYNFNRGTADGNNSSFTTLPDQAGPNSGTLNNFALSGPASNWTASGVSITGEGAQSAYSTAISATICAGTSYTLGTQTLSASGIYTEHFTSSTGCDSLVTLTLTVHDIPVTTHAVSSCGAYTWAQNGSTYNASGIYSDTLAGMYGCDSIISLDLTILQATYGTVQHVSACNSYTWSQNGQIYTTGGLYTDTIPNAAGCDSILSLDLTLNTSSYGPVETVNACVSYTWSQNGHTYTSGGLYTDTIPNAAGCDSILTLNLTLNAPTYGAVETMSACGSYLWLQTGETYTVSGTYTDTIPNVNGCDSILTLDLTINTGYSATETVALCGTSYTWAVDNHVYTASGLYLANLIGVNGCDSVLALDLTLNALPVAEIFDNGNGLLIVAAQGTIVEAWIDCETGVPATGQQDGPTFAPLHSGSYAVVVSDPVTGCSDTSDCHSYAMLGLEEISTSALRIFPNPASDNVTLSFSASEGTLVLRDAQGQIVLEASVQDGHTLSLAHLAAGVYVAELRSGQGRAVQRVVKN